MQLALVIGRTTATVKHASLDGQRLMIVQPLTLNGGNDGDPVIAIDEMGAKKNDKVVITTDAKHAAELTKRRDCPVRFTIIGLPDEKPLPPQTNTPQQTTFAWGA